MIRTSIAYITKQLIIIIVFDGHDDGECGSLWQSSSYSKKNTYCQIRST